MQVRRATIQDLAAAARHIAIGLGVVLLATLVVAVLQGAAGVPNASAVYLLAAALAALAAGRTGAVTAAVSAFLLYDFLFIPPVGTFTVNQPGEWLNLVLLLVIGLLVGQLAALLGQRADDALRREQEARSLFAVSRELATRGTTLDALPRIAEILRADAGLGRVWMTAESQVGRPRILVDTAPGEPMPASTGHILLRRTPGDQPARWDTIHAPGLRGPRPTRPGPSGLARLPGPQAAVLRVAMDAGGRAQGTIWGTRWRSSGVPGRSATRLLAAAADQVAQALEQDRLAAEAREAEIARRSDALKTALLESVSHDLRTPLASIRAAAGSLKDPSVVLDEADRRASAEAIDREAARLNRLVTNLLDLSRIEAGELRADREAYVLGDAIHEVLGRAGPILGPRPLDVRISEVPPVLLDAVFFDQVLLNLLENVRKYTPHDVPVRITVDPDPARPIVRVTVEDGGPGVPDDALPRLFDKFYRVPGRSGGTRGGTGIGLAVVRGLTEAMGGRVVARRSALGGLAVDLDLEVAAMPAGVAE